MEESVNHPLETNYPIKSELAQTISDYIDRYRNISPKDKPKRGRNAYWAALNYKSLYEKTGNKLQLREYARWMIKASKENYSLALREVGWAIHSQKTPEDKAICAKAEKKEVTINKDTAGQFIVNSMLFQCGSAASDIYHIMVNPKNRAENTNVLKALQARDIPITQENTRRMLLISVTGGNIQSSRKLIHKMTNPEYRQDIYRNLLKNKDITPDNFDRWCYQVATLKKELHDNQGHIFFKRDMRDLENPKILPKTARVIQKSLIADLKY